MPSKFVEKCGRWTTHTKSAHESSSSSKHKTHHMSWTEINHGFKKQQQDQQKTDHMHLAYLMHFNVFLLLFRILFSWRFKDFKSNLINMLCGMRVCASLCEYILDFLYIVYCNENNLMHNIIQSKWFAVWWIINNNNNNTTNSGIGSGSMYEWLLRIMNKCYC